MHAPVALQELAGIAGGMMHECLQIKG
jgi:hypothetical protein